MKSKFSGYYKDKDLTEVLRTKDAVIVLDSSVLCNLYGFHDEVWEPVLDILQIKSDCLWLPYNMAAKYHRGIVTILIKKIQLLISLMNRLRQTVDMLKNLPFSFPESHSFEEMSKSISKELTLEVAKIKQRGKKDSEIRSRISELYCGRGGSSNNDPDPKSFKMLSYKEVTEADALSGKRAAVTTSNATLGEQSIEVESNDVIFHTLIKLSKDKDKDIIYVTSEPSEYWSIFIGKTSYGPNPEHQSFFDRETNGHRFYCCAFASFMQKLAVSQNTELSDEIKSSLRKLSYGAMIQNDEMEQI